MTELLSSVSYTLYCSFTSSFCSSARLRAGSIRERNCGRYGSNTALPCSGRAPGLRRPLSQIQRRRWSLQQLRPSFPTNQNPGRTAASPARQPLYQGAQHRPGAKPTCPQVDLCPGRVVSNPGAAAGLVPTEPAMFPHTAHVETVVLMSKP